MKVVKGDKDTDEFGNAVWQHSFKVKEGDVHVLVTADDPLSLEIFPNEGLRIPCQN